MKLDVKNVGFALDVTGGMAAEGVIDNIACIPPNMYTTPVSIE